MTETGDLVQLARDRDLCIQYLDKQLTSSGLCHPSTVDSGKEVEITSDSQFGKSPFYIPKGKPVYDICANCSYYVSKHHKKETKT